MPHLEDLVVFLVCFMLSVFWMWIGIDKIQRKISNSKNPILYRLVGWFSGWPLFAASFVVAFCGWVLLDAYGR